MKQLRILSVLTISALSLLACLTSCSSSSEGIMTKEQQEKVESRLESRDWIPSREKESSEELQQAMDFLYAYMPFGDVAEYPEELFRTNAELALATKTEMTWGAKIPQNLFLHFVLPVRINNETLDTARCDFYRELKNRTKDLSMMDAILETNHWCHEKVVYTPTDGRTFSNSALVRNAAGRCGEESTFTVAALRAIGIPARQIYVPRWAHSDDNHAWVEAWADGKWYYIGACEPEAVVNKGWFDAPAKRSLLMFSEVFGDYSSTEEDIISKNDGITVSNVTANYAPVKTFTAIVKDTNGEIVEDAEVSFNIYNYGELFPAIRQTTDSKGSVSFTSGLGDVILLAKKDGKFGHSVIDLRTEDTIDITLEKDGTSAFSFQENLTPPVQLPVEGKVSKEAAKANQARLAEENAIRGAYVATFLTKEDAAKLATKINIPASRLEPIINKARGNSQEIYDFLVETPAEKMSVAVDLLEVISKKDLQDTPKGVLRNHLDGAFAYKDQPYFKEFILNPRIDGELLTPYRDVLAKVTLKGAKPRSGFDKFNEDHLAVSPLAVNHLGLADKAAYVRYMIALYRSCGVAARKEPLTERPQFFDGDKWALIELPWSEETTKSDIAKGTLEIKLASDSPIENPKYYSHFTLAKLDNGEFKSIDMSSTVATDMGEGISYKSLCTQELALEPGTYQLITGNRMADGTVLLQAEVFLVKAGENSNVNMVLRQDSDDLQVIGKLDPESLYVAKGKDTESSLLSTTGRGYFIVAVIDAQKEPTTHFLRGLEAIKDELEAWNRPIVLIFRDKEEEANFKASQFPNLPSTVKFGSDFEGKTADMLTTMLELNNPQWPIVALGDTFGRVVYISTGYNTSVRDQIKTTLSKL